MHTVFSQADSTRALAVKRWGYLLFLVVPLLAPTGWLLGRITGWTDPLSFFTLVAVFGLVPLLDLLIGVDTSSPSAADLESLEHDLWYRLLPFLALPACAVLLLWGSWVFVHEPYGWLGKLGHVLSVGASMGIVGITSAHEMVHKPEKPDQRVGGWLLAMVCYGGFKVEHVRGHHVTVSTPEDRSSARFGQSIYRFLPRAYAGNFVAAWRLEAKRLRQRQHPVLSWRNEVLRLSMLSLALGAGLGALLGWPAVLFFLAQSFVAVTELEIVNYIEHYGLHRRLMPNGRWERAAPQHSWNAPWLLTNLFTLQLQRHSDHHAEARRRYSALRHYENVPTLPAGYAAMIVLALVPPLWFRIMNPRVRAWYGDDSAALTI